MAREIAERVSDFLQAFLQWGSRRQIEDERFRALMREADALLWDVQAPEKEKAADPAEPAAVSPFSAIGKRGLTRHDRAQS